MWTASPIDPPVNGEGRGDGFVETSLAPETSAQASSRIKTPTGDILQRAATRAADLPVMRYAIKEDPGSVIPEHAEARQCDLIVMGCRTEIAPDDKLGESVSDVVSQRARVPVLVVRP